MKYNATQLFSVQLIMYAKPLSAILLEIYFLLKMSAMQVQSLMQIQLQTEIFQLKKLEELQSVMNEILICKKNTIMVLHIPYTIITYILLYNKDSLVVEATPILGWRVNMSTLNSTTLRMETF